MLECVGINFRFVCDLQMLGLPGPLSPSLHPLLTFFERFRLLVLRGGFNPLEQRCG